MFHVKHFDLIILSNVSRETLEDHKEAKYA